jgi:prepilin-type N-terminal cleavage/methylation domain-containing protein
MKYYKNRIIKENEGFSLVEVLIAVIILAIVSVLMIQGVNMSRKAYTSNKIKTEASALANQEIEKIRSMSFNDIGIIGQDPAGTIELQTVINDFTVDRSVLWVAGSDNKIKQVKIVVSNPALINNIRIVTEISPMGMSIAAASTTTSSGATTTVPATTTTIPATTTTVPATTTTVPAETTVVQYPPPNNLTIISNTAQGSNRTVVISWQRPSNISYGIDHYNIYRNNSVIDTIISNNQTIQYTNINNKNTSYAFYITAVYSNGIESLKSNEVST